MRTWLLDLSISPPSEHAHRWGLITHLELQDTVPVPVGKLWSRRFQSMDWMEDPSLTVVRTGAPYLLASVDIDAMLAQLRQIHISFEPLERIGAIHPTTYRLTMHSGSHSCQLEWFNALPPEWGALAAMVELLEALGLKALQDDPSTR